MNMYVCMHVCAMMQYVYHETSCHQKSDMHNRKHIGQGMVYTMISVTAGGVRHGFSPDLITLCTALVSPLNYDYRQE